MLPVINSTPLDNIRNACNANGAALFSIVAPGVVGRFGFASRGAIHALEVGRGVLQIKTIFSPGCRPVRASREGGWRNARMAEGRRTLWPR